MRYVVFDIETSNVFEEAGSSDPAALDLSIVGAYDSETGAYTSYTQEELGGLWPLIEQADALVGYNSDHFDIPLLNKYYQGDLRSMKSIDLLRTIRTALGRRLKLDSVAAATLGEGKSSHGLQAIRWWREGEVEKVRKYCLDDVRITKDLYEYVLANGHIKYKDGGNLRELPLDTSEWGVSQKSPMTGSLPF